MDLPKSELTLWYETILLGHIHEAFCSDSTWYGVFERQPTVTNDPQADRLLEFITFCEDWCHRSKSEPHNPPDAAEFDRFNDVIKSRHWFTQAASGERQSVIEAPVFFPGGDVS